MANYFPMALTDMAQLWLMNMRSFIQRFSQVRNTIPCIFNAFVVVAFR
jgi:hypothetical protein